ncbi:MAG TPA: hypothetical protein VD741_03620 [Solirubrobacterales bacterium]|nr:hypothetical protein [Solirubrobacterales bacterium]
MPTYLLEHRHEAAECEAASAAWRGFESPLRHRSTFSSCLGGGHRIWWQVEAADEGAALAQLPPYVADRTVAVRVRAIALP